VTNVFREILLPFFTALGIVLGGSLIGSISYLLVPGSPLSLMLILARDLKLWGILVAIGGTMPTLRIIESGLFQGELLLLFRQLGVIVSSFAGANLAYWLLATITGGK
jgi:hypothetical protein